mmetsp:Transcript_10274/g.11807  ORF Transcript_10274/g.11807 Transcript_10274/m.11807 type:complete len:369 (-) Transcript_10274:125-1231(-)
MFDRFRGFRASKVKPALTQAMIRIQLFKNKKQVSISASKKAVVDFLKADKIEKARLEAERIVRADFTIEAYDILELMCELVRDNIKTLEADKQCPYDMVEAVSTILYATDRTEIPELKVAKEQFIKKYGKEFFEDVIANKGGVVNERVLHRLSGQRPNAFLVLSYMKEVAKEKGLDWEPDELTKEVGERFDAPMVGPDGSSINPGTASGLGSAAYQVTDGRILQQGNRPISSLDSSSAPQANQNANDLQSHEPVVKQQNNDPLSVDNLAARFNAFKNTSNSATGPNKREEDTQDQVPDVDDGGLDFDIPEAPTHDTNDITEIPNFKSQTTPSQSNSNEQEHLGEKDPAVPGYDELLNRFSKLKSGGKN